MYYCNYTYVGSKLLRKMKKLKGGVLIIGSLLWDKAEIRENWRNNYLIIENKLEVNIPIRYGRLSSKRISTYTMVFSSECTNKKKFGNGKFIPFKNNPINFNDLNSQCFELIKAEHKKEELNFNRYNWGWGTVTIMFNPKILEKSNDKYKSAQYFIEEWKKKIGNGFNPNHYQVDDEKMILDSNAILKFIWPDKLDDYDFFISTSNKSDLKKYPTAKQIAKNIDLHGNEYFFNNIENNITTFQDELIKKHLINEKN